MVREEYLNPEFMYKFINSLCKADDWIMYHFVFGKLVYKNLNQPILLKNNHGYNMVYKFKVYKLRKDAEYGEFSTTHKAEKCFCVSSKKLDKCFIDKTVYFDILNECFVEDDDTVDTFEEFPPFFRLNDQLYYGIYGQPKVLKYHYSQARDCNDLKEYMLTMNITAKNFFDACSLLYNTVDSSQRYIDIWWSGAIKFYFETKEEAISTINKALNENYDCTNFYEVQTTKYGNPTVYCRSSKRLYIHKPEFPVFYTDNILELTVPIAESVSTLAKGVAKIFSNVQYMLSLLSNSTQMLMAQRLEDHYSALLRKNMSFLLSRTGEASTYKLYEEAMRSANKGTENDRSLYKDCSTHLSFGLSLLSKVISEAKIDAVYKELDLRIRDIKADTSLTTLLEISNDFKRLENKIDK